jgi:hypothetical protein
MNRTGQKGVIAGKDRCLRRSLLRRTNRRNIEHGAVQSVNKRPAASLISESIPFCCESKMKRASGGLFLWHI